MGRGSLVAVASFIASAVAGAATAPDTGRESLHATLWMQVAPEYRAITEQVYQLAEERIAAPSRGSAALEQWNIADEVLARLPTAVVLDLDETVLDNTVYQARLLRDGTSYNAKTWGEWIAAAEAEAVPGARQFIARARALGHTVFYITNRDCTTPAPTATDPCPAKTATHAQPGGARHRSGARSATPAVARRAPRMEQRHQDASSRIHRR